MYGAKGREESACWVLNNKTIINIHVGNAIISVGEKFQFAKISTNIFNVWILNYPWEK